VSPPPNAVPMQAVVGRLCERIAQLEFENAILRCQVEGDTAPVSPPGEPT